MDELQELLEDRLAQLDVAAPEAEQATPADWEPMKEDFPKDDEWRVALVVCLQLIHCFVCR